MRKWVKENVVIWSHLPQLPFVNMMKSSTFGWFWQNMGSFRQHSFQVIHNSEIWDSEISALVFLCSCGLSSKCGGALLPKICKWGHTKTPDWLFGDRKCAHSCVCPKSVPQWLQLAHMILCYPTCYLKSKYGPKKLKRLFRLCLKTYIVVWLGHPDEEVRHMPATCHNQCCHCVDIWFWN